MDIENTLLKIAPILEEAGAFVAGSSVIKMIDPTVNFEAGDIDIYVNGKEKFDKLVENLSVH